MSHTVLVVEDDTNIRNGMMALMRTRGHRAVAAASVAEAVARLDDDNDNGPAAPTHVFLDLNLPDGSGTDVLRIIRQRSLPVRVALLTGASDAALLAEARALGVEGVFVKPANWDQVLDWVDAGDARVAAAP